MVLRFILIFIIGCFTQLNSDAQTVIKMRRDGGVSVISCKVNGLKLDFIFDTGASDVSISLTEVLFMMKNGYLNKEDIIGTNKYYNADGDLKEGLVVNLKEVEIAGRKLYNIKASIVKNTKAPLLLGQSAIGKLGKIQIDLEENTLTILTENTSNDFSYKRQNVNEEYFKIGQNYNNGTIFHIDNTGKHGLIVYDPELSTDLLGVGYYADAQNKIDELNRNSYVSWRIPSKFELQLLSVNSKVLKKRQLFIKRNGQLVPTEDKNNGTYWSSSECYNGLWVVGLAGDESKCTGRYEYMFGIIAVRSF
jgi:hypothetical protein